MKTNQFSFGAAITFTTFLLTLALSPAHAALVANGSFESPGFASPPNYRYLANGSTAITGWTVSDDGIGEQPYWYDSSRYSVSDGNYAVALNQGSGLHSAVSLAAGTLYHVQLDFQNTISDGAGHFTPNPLQIIIGSISTTINPNADLNWYTHGFDFTASTTDASAILEILNNSPVGDFRGYNVDAVSLTIVPEPSTYLAGVLLLLLLGAGAARRLRRM
jgi:hypothetical protein